MNKAYVMIGLHNHQPVGNFEHVFSEAYDKCYHPTLETLERYPHIKIALHHSGPLIEWIERNKPEYIERLRGMVKRGQVELLSGGFYEPILSSLPEADAVGQIVMMNEWIEKNFGVRPRGAWMAERIWDPSLPKILAAAGIQYTLLDDTHFFYAGLGQDDMYGYWVTEKHGSAVAVFPIDKELRYSIPFKQPEETINYFRDTVAKRGPTGFTYGDDGEKFGVWPETHEWVFGKKWLERFLNTVSENAGFVEPITYGEYLDRFPPRGRIYLPMASYEEMMHWTLPTEAAIEHTRLVHQIEHEGRKEQFKKFLRGGLWDNFLAKYPESNQLHKRMLYVSKRVTAALAKAKKKGDNALTAPLYRGQCNCPYWHGLFGGLYLSNLRHAVYSNLIEAGRNADALLHKGKAWAEVTEGDYLMDMRTEVAVETPDLFALFAPAQGGALAELDFKPSLFNLSNVMARRPEEYHRKILEAVGKTEGGKEEILSIHDRVVFKEKSLEKKLVFDRFPRYSFIDHLFAQPPTADELQAQTFAEAGDFAGEAYALEKAAAEGGNALLVMARQGRIEQGGAVTPLRIRKSVAVSGKDATLECRYEVTNMGGAPAEFVLGVEWNFTLLAADALDRYITIRNEKYRMNHKGENAAQKWSVTDEYFRFTLTFEADAEARLLHYPVETVSQSEGGFESTYQGTCFTALVPIELGANETAARTFTLHCRKWND